MTIPSAVLAEEKQRRMGRLDNKFKPASCNRSRASSAGSRREAQAAFLSSENHEVCTDHTLNLNQLKWVALADEKQ